MASVVQLVFIASAVWVNHFSGIDPSSQIALVPVYVAMEAAAGLLILAVVKIRKIPTIVSPSEFLVFGGLLGLAHSGSIIGIWHRSVYVELLTAVIVLIVATIAAIGESRNGSEHGKNS